MNKNKSNLLIVNIFFGLIPMSFILGNFAINLNIVILFLLSLFFYYEKLQYLKFNSLDKIITFFFIYIFYVLIINFFEARFSNQALPSIIITKTFFYFRYYLLYISLRLLVSQNLLKLNWFFLSCAFCSIFVCLDVYFQYFFGKDIFRITPISLRNLSGPFGQELIAGGYIQRFSLFALFLPFIFKQKKAFNKFLILSLFVFIFTTGIILSGNRMPLILYIFSLFLIGLFKKNWKKQFISLSVIFIIILTLFYYNNKSFRYNSGNFYRSTKHLINVFSDKNISIKQDIIVNRSSYVNEFYSFYDIWKKNIYFGGGIRSYRANCPRCNSHPHNYYLEILDDLGLFGFFIIIILISFILHKAFIKKYIFKLQHGFDQKILALFYVLFIEFFPIRSSGSFFSTNNASFIFIALALLVSLIERYKKIEENKNLKN